MNQSKQNNISMQTEHQSEAENLLVATKAATLLKFAAEDVRPNVANALAKSRQAAVAQLAAQPVAAHGTHVLQWLGTGFKAQFMQHPAMSAVFALALVSFFALQQFAFNDNLENSDAFLLASDLPPEAFADKGFDTWLVSSRD